MMVSAGRVLSSSSALVRKVPVRATPCRPAGITSVSVHGCLKDGSSKPGKALRAPVGSMSLMM
ncbi:hypothetical protein D3C83_91550 [compost metagenome]